MFANMLRVRSNFVRPLVYACVKKASLNAGKKSFAVERNFTNKYCDRKLQFIRLFSTESVDLVDAVKFEEVCEETLESLCEYFEDLVESCSHLKGADVVFGDGVLTVMFGEPYGTYVINRQTPNRQIWLSSPTSGPKRYDFVMKDDGFWVYKHDGMSLHKLLQTEIEKITKKSVDFSKCAHSLV